MVRNQSQNLPESLTVLYKPVIATKVINTNASIAVCRVKGSQMLAGAEWRNFSIQLQL